MPPVKGFAHHLTVEIKKTTEFTNKALSFMSIRVYVCVLVMK